MPEAQVPMTQEVYDIAAMLGVEPETIVGRGGGCRLRLPVEGQRSKECLSCRHVWHVSSFYKNRTASDGLQAFCKQCCRDKDKKRKRSKVAQLEDAKQQVIEEARGEVAKITKIAEKAAGKTPEGQKTTRTKWPSNKWERRRRVLLILKDAMIEHTGQVSAIAAALNLPVDEIMEYVDHNPEMRAVYEQCQNEANSQVEGHFFHLATTSNSATAPMFWLKNRMPEKWADKTTLDVKQTFGPPEGETAPVSVLEHIVKREN